MKMGYFKTLGIEAKLIAGSGRNGQLAADRRQNKADMGYAVAGRA